MNGKLWIRKAFSSCLIVAILATYSMVALANSDRVAGELFVSGRSVNGVTPSITVNGETAKSGRTVFSASTITTPENASAVIDMGTAGEIELSSGSNAVLSFDTNIASVDLNSGSVTVLRSKQPVTVNTAGETNQVTAGGSASSGGSKDDHDYRDSNGKCVDANKNGKEECDAHGVSWALWALVFGGAAAGVIIGVSQSNNDITLGGAGNVVSPTR
jgi:hypothetical protein